MVRLRAHRHDARSARPSRASTAAPAQAVGLAAALELSLARPSRLRGLSNQVPLAIQHLVGAQHQAGPGLARLDLRAPSARPSAMATRFRSSACCSLRAKASARASSMRAGIDLDRDAGGAQHTRRAPCWRRRGRAGWPRHCSAECKLRAPRRGRGSAVFARSNWMMLAAVSSIERRVTSRICQLFSLQSRRASDHFVAHRGEVDIVGILVAWRSSACGSCGSAPVAPESLVRPTTIGFFTLKSSDGSGQPGTIGTLAALMPRLAR